MKRIEEYYYCRNCKSIIYNPELDKVQQAIRCSKCKGYDLVVPAWVRCPHRKASAVKCPRAGEGIEKGECKYRCEY